MTTAKQTPAQVNAMVLNELLSSPNIRRYRYSLGVQNVTPGATASNTVLNFLPVKTGQLLGFYVRTKLVIAPTTAVLKPSVAAFAKVLQAIKYTDFSGTLRHNTTGMELNNVMAMRHGGFLGLNGTDYVGSTPLSLGNVLSALPPTSTTANTNIEVWQYVPLAERVSGQLKGMEWAQFQQQQATLTLEIGLGSATDPLSGVYAGTAEIVSGTVEVIQDYYSGSLPQVNGQPILAPVSNYNAYCIRSQNFPLNLTAGGQTLHYLDQSFEYLSYMFLYDNGSSALNPASTAQGTPDLTAIGLYNSVNTPIYNDSPAMIALHNASRLPQREAIPGMYFLDFADRPIYGSVNGQYAIGITPATVNAGTTSRYTVESILPSNG
jgi:hypothetical protein